MSWESKELGRQGRFVGAAFSDEINGKPVPERREKQLHGKK